MGKVTEHHLRRAAVVYIRQSSLAQVRRNVESQRLQYALTERAHALGWKQAEVIDCDLGTSASMGSSQRTGFNQLISDVALGRGRDHFDSRGLSALSHRSGLVPSARNLSGPLDTHRGRAIRLRRRLDG